MSQEDEIKKLQEENIRLKELQSAKTDLVTISSHQIKTSLSALKWIIKMFLNGDLGKLTAEEKSLLEKAYEDNDRAIETVNDLLSSNRNEGLVEKEYNFTNLNLPELIEDCIFDFTGEAHINNIEIIFLKPEKDFPLVSADKEKIRIVLQNLLENAIKYNVPRGKIFISLNKKSSEIEFSIKDTGMGINEENQKRIFEKFYRSDRAQKKQISGSGMGLFIIKEILEKHGGKIWLQSKENEGTTFFFTLKVVK